MVVLLSGTFLGVLDGYVVTVALPSLQRDLDTTYSEVQWIPAGYGLAYAVLLVTGARLGDRYGRRRLFVMGMAFFTVCSAVCGLAEDAGVLIAARLAQGASAAMALPQVLSIIRSELPVGQRGSAMGWYGAVVGTGVTIGPAMGGLLLAAVRSPDSWRWIFLSNIPAGLLITLVAARSLPASRTAVANRLDLGGVALSGLAVAAVLIPLTWVREAGWQWWNIAAAAAAPWLLLTFVVHERTMTRRGRDPLLPLTLVADRRFTMGVLVVLVLFAAGAGAPLLLLLTYYLQSGLGLSPASTGLVFAPLGLGFAVASWSAPRLVTMAGPTVPAYGVATVSAALAGMAVAIGYVPGTQVPLVLTTLLLLAGAGQGLAVNPLLASVLSRVTGEDSGAASGLLLTATQLGNAVGLTVVGAVYFGQLGAGSAVRFPSVLTGILVSLAICTAILVPAVLRAVRAAPAGTRSR